MDDLKNILDLYSNFYYDGNSDNSPNTDNSSNTDNSNSFNRKYIVVKNRGVINIKRPDILEYPPNYEDVIKKYTTLTMNNTNNVIEIYKVNTIENILKYFTNLPNIDLSHINDFPIMYKNVTCDITREVLVSNNNDDSSNSESDNSISRIRYYRYNNLDISEEVYKAHQIKEKAHISDKVVEFDKYIYCPDCKKLIYNDFSKYSTDSRFGERDPISPSDNKPSVSGSNDKSCKRDRINSVQPNDQSSSNIRSNNDSSNNNKDSRVLSTTSFNYSLFQENARVLTNNTVSSNILRDIYHSNTLLPFKKLFYQYSNIADTTQLGTTIRSCTHPKINQNINIKYSCDMCGYGSMLNWIPILKQRGCYGYILLNCNPKSPNYGKIAYQGIKDETDYEFIRMINSWC